nr:MAG: bile acid:sodium symporter [Pseudomonadota bacterium]
MAVAVCAAFALPDPGARGGALHPEVVNKVGVAIVFFLHGLLLPFASLKAGLVRWPLHALVQGTTFVVFPALGALLFLLGGDRVAPELGVGVVFLCALPSTVSSCVALTAVAHGNIAAAVLNATLSSVLGIFLTPLWLGAIAGSTGQGPSVGTVIADLARLLLLPLAVGQLARPVLGEIAQRHRARVSVVDRGTILLLVYTSFSDSVKAGVWDRYGAAPVLVASGVAVCLLVGGIGFASLASRLLRLPVEDRIAAVFCGSTKSLAAGVPMAQVLFGAHPGLGLILLPILLYHALQLFVGGSLAARWAMRSDRSSPTPPRGSA